MTRRRSRPRARLLLAAVAALALSACAGAPERAMVAPEASLKMAEIGGERDVARAAEAAPPKNEAAAPAPAEAAPARTIATQPVFRPGRRSSWRASKDPTSRPFPLWSTT